VVAASQNCASLDIDYQDPSADVAVDSFVSSADIVSTVDNEFQEPKTSSEVSDQRKTEIKPVLEPRVLQNPR